MAAAVTVVVEEPVVASLAIPLVPAVAAVKVAITLLPVGVVVNKVVASDNGSTIMTDSKIL